MAQEREKTQRQLKTEYIMSLLLYGTNGVAASMISLNSTQIVLLRTCFGWLVMAVAYYIRGGRLRDKPKRDMRFVALSGLCMAANWLFLFEAYVRIGVGLGMIINYCGPVLVMLLSGLLFRERLTGGVWLALALCLGGAGLISFQAAEQLDPVGLLCAGLAAVSYAGMVLFNQQTKHFTGPGRVLVQLTATLGAVVLFSALHGELGFSVARDEWIGVLWLGALNTGLGSYWYFGSIGLLPVREVSVLGYLEPLSVLAFSALLLHETLRPMQLLGAAMILGGTAAMELRRKKKT